MLTKDIAITEKDALLGRSSKIVNAVLLDKLVTCSEYSNIKWMSPSKQIYWYGYYNYSPICYDGTKLLAHRCDFDGRMPQPGDKVDVGFFDLPNGRWNRLASSSAFNWQQGSMLQWLGPDFNSRIVFNDLEKDHYVSRIMDLDTGHTVTIQDPVYAIAPEGNYSLTLCFERSYWTRAYSYAPISNDKWNTRIPKDDGIFRLDLVSGEKKRILSIEGLIEFAKIQDDGVSSHWLEHIQMNPSGTRFAFYHRYGTNENFVSNLYTADSTGENLWRHPLGDSDRLSHLGWRSSYEYVVYAYIKKKRESIVNSSTIAQKSNPIAKMITAAYRKIVKPTVLKHSEKDREKRQHYQLTLDTVGVQKKYSGGLLSRDGHPSFTRSGRYMLTDTYSDQEGYRNLYMYDMELDREILLAKVYSVYNSCGWRADLHPRFSPDENTVIVDSSHNGYHQMIVFDIDWDRIKE